jgi:hypothetical protein
VPKPDDFGTAGRPANSVRFGCSFLRWSSAAPAVSLSSPPGGRGRQGDRTKLSRPAAHQSREVLRKVSKIREAALRIAGRQPVTMEYAP